ncbi:transglycosylase SLT domain-containing protein [Gluconobacter cerinus]|uniref:transglycosylase SLT domain-containing protein n=1 Tax=Gluconobacter cerinus TaxID=38307 RepID=UPI001B8B5157|nr:transglycosylase SLT domain-containing protein [Gluconobacter cerinus]
MGADVERHYDGAGRYWNVNPAILRAVHQLEDPQDDPKIQSRAGAVGHMQFMPDTARRLSIDPTDPVQSIYGAARLLRENLDRYGNVPDALRAYNAGTDRTHWGNPETMAYPQKVADHYATPSPQENPFDGPGTSAEPEASPAAKTGGDAFGAVFGGSTQDKTAPKAGDPFNSVFGHDAETTLPAQAHAHQGTWLGNLAQFARDADESAGAELVKAGANIVDGITLHHLRGTEYDPVAYKKSVDKIVASRAEDWGNGVAKLGGQLLGDAGVAYTAGRVMPSLGTGLAANALTQGIQGATTASLVDQNPLLGGALGAASAPVGAVASRAVKALRKETPAISGASNSAEDGARLSDAEPETAASQPPEQAPEPVLPQSKPAPEAVKLGLLTGPKQADKLAARIWNDYQQGGPVALVASKIPGVHLTASQATGNAGLAQLERVRRAANPNLFTALDAQNSAARNAYAQKIIGTDDQLEAAEAARATLEAQHRDAAFAEQAPVDVTPIRQHLARLIDDNRGRETVQQPLINVLRQLNNVAEEDGTAMPDKLWNVRKYLGDMVLPRAQGTANDGQAAASQLLALKPTITDQIDGGAPGFKTYLQHYEDMSRPIDAMRYLQGRKLTDAQGNVQLGKLDGFLNTIKQEQRKSGARPADSVTDEQFKALTDLRDDMRLHARIDLGKARGSDTNVNLMTSSKVAKMAQGVAPKVAAMGAGYLEGGALGGLLANGAAGLVERRMMGRMANTEKATLDYLDNALANPRLLNGGR